ncbi:hypothetical protein DERF_011351 [Dermatophagoides farinae]|uniref:Uncharacterized protein n=1 Tax=Dermatophagoides farinae TaxID=6954 RepID=A0A922HWY1_DERFA|nr:hypothetical protein DERF_011351 [Dermatophagoides farinae]
MFVLKISRNGRLSFAALNAKLIHSASTQCKHLASVKVAVTDKSLSFLKTTIGSRAWFDLTSIRLLRLNTLSDISLKNRLTNNDKKTPEH